MTQTATLLLAAIMIVSVGRADDNSSAEPLNSARSLFQHGNYDDALAAYEKLTKSSDKAVHTAAVIGVSRVHESRGDWEDAATVVTQAIESDKQNANLWGRLSELLFRTGQYEDTRKSVDQALSLDSEQLAARLIDAHLNREMGKLDEAVNAYRWFVRYYNRKQPEDAETLLYVAEGSLEYARWKRVSSIFHFCVNTLCPDALKADPDSWQAARLSGELLLEKYNEAQAIPEFEAAKKINPHAAEVYTSLAKASLQNSELNQARLHVVEALTHNPRMTEALILLSQLELEDGDAELAMDAAQEALAINPRDQRALARKAVCFLYEDGIPNKERLRELFINLDAPDKYAPKSLTRFEQLTLDLAQANPAPGEYLSVVGEFFESRLKFDRAEVCYEAAIDVMPQLADPRTALGMLAMRTGRIDEAKQILDDAFKADPFHVRVSNMRKVIDVIKGYETIRTENFLIRVDASDKMLGEYMGEYLEEVHAELIEQYGYEPQTRTQFEVYSDAKGQSAHQWFSARMVGLPWIQTIGASTGMIVALASPTAIDQPYHWARVLKHEYVHILTLQQTDFNIPHWYTEALAVRTEGLVMPDPWKRLLKERVPTGELFTLETVNNGFRRPDGPDDWTMAYCQSRLYADFLEQTYGKESLAELLTCYTQGLSTPKAIRQVTGIDSDEFESRYQKYLKSVVEDLHRSAIDPEIDLDQANQASLANPEDAGKAGRYAYALLSDRDRAEAGRMAQKALTRNPREPFASAVLAKLALERDETDEALKILENGWDESSPSAVILGLLAETVLSEDKLNRAAELYLLGTKQFPREDAFWKGRAVALLKLGQDEQAMPILEELADRDPENTGYRRKLAEIAFDNGDHKSAAHWAREVLFVDLEDVDAHILRGRAAAQLGQREIAQRELEIASDLDSSHNGIADLRRELNEKR